MVQPHDMAASASLGRPCPGARTTAGRSSVSRNLAGSSERQPAVYCTSTSVAGSPHW